MTIYYIRKAINTVLNLFAFIPDVKYQPTWGWDEEGNITW